MGTRILATHPADLGFHDLATLLRAPSHRPIDLTRLEHRGETYAG